MSIFKFAAVAVVFLAGASSLRAVDVERTYIVRLGSAPLVEHVHQQLVQRGIRSKSEMRRQLESSDAADYLRQLDASREQVLASARAALGRDVQPRHIYRHAGNGIALRLTEREAAQLAGLPGVQSIRPERRERLLTDAGPQWIGADRLWNGQVSGIAATKGEGVVIGIVDTGINSAHPAFAAQGADGYAIANPRGHFYGLCTTGVATCNNKLIGIYDFTDEGTHGADSVGHGSHVAGIAAGNALADSLQGHTVALQRQVSGVAPHANVIMYKACVNKTASNPDGGCAESDLVAALDQATADGVDVINYSIGGDAIDPYALLDAGNNDAASMFQARAAGIVVVVAAGNDGPGPHSIDEPGNVPWVISVANASHNRRFANALGDFSGASGSPPALNGQGYTAGYGPANIVYAGNYGNALCGIGDSEGTAPTGASNPFAAGTFHGEIVICDRGTYARVEKGYNVLHAGAGGFALANTAADGESTVSDDQFLPAVHLGYTEGAQLKEWLNSSGAHTGKIAGVSAALDSSFGDILEVSSSRGPTGFGVLKPDLTAPGTNILSAARTGAGEALMTGTSMASPHVAGAAALFVAAHPSWFPAQIESALIGSALAGSVRKEDAATLGTPLDAGAGRVQPANGAKAGLFLPLSANDIRAQDPAHGGKPESLNRPGIESESCYLQCAFARSVTDMSGGGTWQASVTASDGAHVTVTPSQFTLAPGASQALNVSVDVSDPRLPGSWVSGRIVLHKSTGGQSAGDFALPLAVYASPGAAPAFQEFTTNKPFFDTTLNLSGLVALPRARFGTATIEPALGNNMSLSVDPTPNDLYSTFPGTGKQFVTFPVSRIWNLEESSPPPLQGRVFIVEIAASTASSATLHAGIDSNGNGQPDFAEQVCESPVHGAGARCVVDLRDAPVYGAVWALVDVPSGTTGATYSVTVSYGEPSLVLQKKLGSYVETNTGLLSLAGPGHVPASTNFPLRATFGSVDYPSWFLPGRYYGAVLVDAAPTDEMPGKVGFIPFSFTRMPGGDDLVDPMRLGVGGQRYYLIAPGETLKHSYFDIPDTRTMTFNTSSWSFGSSTATPSMTVYVARTDIPPASVSAQVDAAPPASAAIAAWSLDDSVPNGRTTTLTLAPGRWYVAAANTSDSDAQLALSTDSSGGTAVPTPPGAFFNPQRSGHGIFVSQAAGQQVVYWYTYLEDGTPVWYAAQGDAPVNGAAAWSAPLFRVNWDGSQVNTYSVLGEVILTPLGADELEFSWHLYGDAGSERFTRLGPASPCVAVGAQQVNLDGQWFAPTQSGYGMDVLALPNFQQDTLYFYDALGQPRWLAGSANAVSGSNALALSQLSGFCPACNWAAAVPTQVGTLTTDFASGTQGHYATQINLAPPLAGSWNIDQPTQRLTGAPACGP